jgi:D-glycero-D-manno-heptose 1,7-bisphosphate phosphatase
VGISSLRKAVFLDRDGVINYPVVRANSPYPPESIDTFRFMPGVQEACRRLSEADYLLIVVTNQPGVARGGADEATVELMNDLVRKELPVEDVLTCFHDDNDRCNCRKPQPGLLLEAAKRWSIDLSESFMVGDRWKDIQAGQAAGCCSILLEYPYSSSQLCEPDLFASDLPEATELILKRGTQK